MNLSQDDVSAITLTLRLAAVTTLFLILVATPLAWWLTHTHTRWRATATALVSLPLVLPPTVLGFYLLVLLGPNGAVGQWMQQLGLATLPFTFGGLVVGSVVFSLPFAVQPIANAFAAIGARPLEVAATLRASPWDRSGVWRCRWRAPASSPRRCWRLLTPWASSA
jgi:molybdate transport system permease protein